MRLPIVVEFRGIAMSASFEQAAREAFAPLVPLTGLIIGANVTLGPMKAGALKVGVRLLLPGATVEARSRAGAASPRSVAAAVERALLAVLPALEAQLGQAQQPRKVA